MIVVADTSPLNYLILIEQIDILQKIYREVVVPPAVQTEMISPRAPEIVRAWIGNLPLWIEIRTPNHWQIPSNPKLGAGELEAIALIKTGGPGSVLLIDERAGREEAARQGIKVTGTLGILEEAARLGLLDLNIAIERLRSTNFKASDAFLREFVKRAKKVQ